LVQLICTKTLENEKRTVIFSGGSFLLDDSLIVS
jgi:hypothetical protein